MNRHIISMLFVILAFSGLAYSCQVISSEGTTTLAGDASGANNSVSGVSGISQACIVIASPNVTLDCAGYSVTNNGTADAAGILVNASSSINYTNVTIENCPSVSQYEYGIYLHYTVEDTIRNSSARNNTYGTYLHYSDYNTITNSTGYNNSYDAFRLYFSSNNTLSENAGYNNSYSGFYLDSNSSSNNLTSNLAYDNEDRGFVIWRNSSYNILTNNTAYSNPYYGFIVWITSNNNSLINNTAYSNSYDGYYLYSNSRNILTNNTAYNNSRYGFNLESSSNNTLTNNTAHNNSYAGFQVYVYSSYNTLTDNTAYGSDRSGYGHGFFIRLNPSYSTLTNNIAYNNSGRGFYLWDNVSYSTLTGNTAYENSQQGFALYTGSNYNALTNNTAYNNSIGLYISSGTGNNITNCTTYNNQYGFYAYRSNHTMQTTRFLPSTGELTNYTNLSVTDNMGASEGYSVNWSSFAGSLPTDRSSFAQRYVNISMQAGTPSIDEITFYWLESELSGYNETYLELWKYNISTGWTRLNNSPDTTNNQLKLYALSPASIYGVLQFNASYCQVISSSGTYTLANNLSGAISFSGIEGISKACMILASDDVVLDCNGYLITNNGTADAAGIVINGSSSIDYTNVTIQNCPAISEYERGVYLYNTSQDTVRNSTALDNTLYGFHLSSSYNNTLANNTGYTTSSQNDGFYLSSSYNNTLTDNIAYGNSYQGFYLLSSSSNNTLTNNIAYSNTHSGFYIYTGSNNTLINNTAYDNVDHGFYIYTSSSNTLTNNMAYDNIKRGFYVRAGSSDNILSGNTAHGNTWGIDLFLTTGTNLSDCVLYNNPYDFYVNTSNYTMQGTSFLPESGEFSFYTNLSINDTLSASEEYTVNWSTISASLPTGYISFARKYVNITTQVGTPSIEEVTFQWLDGELTSYGYSESYFELWKYNNSDGWTVLNETPDVANNYLKLYSLDPSSIYGILQLDTSVDEGSAKDAPECSSDSDCNECYYCSVAAGECLLKSESECANDGDCSALGDGYTCESCVCIAPECVTDSDCGEGEYCSGYQCLEMPGCTSSDDCDDDEYCSDGSCLGIECDCGDIADHKCRRHECCDDSDCGRGYECRSHSCVAIPEEEGTDVETPVEPPPEEEEQTPLEEEVSELVEEVAPSLELGEGEGGLGETSIWETAASGAWTALFAVGLIAVIYVLFFRSRAGGRKRRM